MTLKAAISISNIIALCFNRNWKLLTRLLIIRQIKKSKLIRSFSLFHTFVFVKLKCNNLGGHHKTAVDSLSCLATRKGRLVGFYQQAAIWKSKIAFFPLRIAIYKIDWLGKGTYCEVSGRVWAICKIIIMAKHAQRHSITSTVINPFLYKALTSSSLNSSPGTRCDFKCTFLCIVYIKNNMKKVTIYGLIPKEAQAWALDFFRNPLHKFSDPGDDLLVYLEVWKSACYIVL